jgi:hypothetical protein
MCKPVSVFKGGIFYRSYGCLQVGYGRGLRFLQVVTGVYVFAFGTRSENGGMEFVDIKGD